MVTLLGTEILRGREIAERVTPEDWLHMTVALLCHDVGYVRGACRGDTATEVVIDLAGTTAAAAARRVGRLAHPLPRRPQQDLRARAGRDHRRASTPSGSRPRSS